MGWGWIFNCDVRVRGKGMHYITECPHSYRETNTCVSATNLSLIASSSTGGNLFWADDINIHIYDATAPMLLWRAWRQKKDHFHILSHYEAFYISNIKQLTTPKSHDAIKTALVRLFHFNLNSSLGTCVSLVPEVVWNLTLSLFFGLFVTLGNKSVKCQKCMQH